MSDLPIACTLSADELRAGADQLIPGLMRLAHRVTRLPDGARLEFESVPGIVTRIAEVVERERQCCRFLHFALDVPEGGGAITLRIDGPDGTGAFLESMAPDLGHLLSADP